MGARERTLLLAAANGCFVSPERFSVCVSVKLAQGKTLYISHAFVHFARKHQAAW